MQFQLLRNIFLSAFILQLNLSVWVIYGYSFEIKYQEFDYPVLLGGTLQVDYRNISNQARADSRFDIRRARLHINGNVTTHLSYKMSVEFQGTENKKLVDAFADYHYHQGLYIRFGQFKMPFSREWQMSDNDFPFAERSIGFSLQPGRDIGLMVGGQFFKQTFSYGLGLFNGDGIDGSTRGSQKDDPELSARLLIQPFFNTQIPVLSGLFSGISYTEGRIDLNNISMTVKTTGMIGTKRNLYTLNANTKFGALLDVDKQKRTSLEGGLSCGPMSLYGEYQRYQYTGLKPVRGTFGDASFYSWYINFIINLYGNSISSDALPRKTLYTKNNQGTWQLALRREYFSGDSQWIIDNAYNSAREANAYSIALNYIAYLRYRLLIDYTVTDISDPLRIRVNPDGTIEYMSSETAFTLRFQITI